MTDNDKSADRGAGHAAELAKSDRNYAAEMVRPLTPQHGHESAQAEIKMAGLAEWLGLACSPSGFENHSSNEPEQEKKSWTQRENERSGQQRGSGGSGGNGNDEQEKKTWTQREDDRNGRKDDSGSNGDQSWQERLRSLPEEQQKEREIERER
jgi:hypothetical protein